MAAVALVFCNFNPCSSNVLCVDLFGIPKEVMEADEDSSETEIQVETREETKIQSETVPTVPVPVNISCSLQIPKTQLGSHQ